MHSFIRFVLTVFIFSLPSFALANLWQPIEESANEELSQLNRLAKRPAEFSENFSFQKALKLKLNQQEMQSRLGGGLLSNTLQARALNPQSAKSQDVLSIPVPLSDGTTIEIKLKPDSTLSKSLANQFPEIRTYRVLANRHVFGGKVDMTPNGFHAMLNMLDGEVVFIDPINTRAGEYVSYKKSDQNQELYSRFSCGVHNNKSYEDHLSHADGSAEGLLSRSSRLAARAPESLLNYRIAVATTAAYAAKHGGTVKGAMAAISTTLSRVNQVLERDLGIHLSLVENNHLLINLDATTEPFTGSTLKDQVYQNQDFIDSIIGSENYDIGHLFTANGGGLAAIGSVCNANHKAQGISGISNPVSDSFDLDFVAHEIGHQLGATHTFNSSQGLCSGSTRTARTAFEPGSGSTIMSYAGYCGLDNLQSNTDAMYHIGSIKQIDEFTRIGSGSHCGVRSTLENQPPVPDAGKNVVIPSRTPFELTGKAQDSDGDTLVYTWEQLDVGNSSEEHRDTGNNALFRAHIPTQNKHRSFPPLSDSLNHTSSKGETLPSHQRTLRMSFVAQDGFNVAQSDDVIIWVERTGSRFALNLPRSQYTLGETYPILWNVAETDKAPINCQNVDISLSTDGGYTYAYELAKSVPNTGDAWITMPSSAELTFTGRFKLKCSDNIFYAVSYRDFLVTNTTAQIAPKYSDEDQPEENLADPDLGALDLESNVSNTNTAGGSLDKYLWLLCLLMFRRKKTNS